MKQPELIWFDGSLSRQEGFTRGLVQSREGRRELSRHGLKWFSLLMWEGR
ncbi:MAG: hypothetical protein HC904_10630 [Blastochloris sp.]|nr:hypothetical protein [Blastochloris sp.]